MLQIKKKVRFQTKSLFGLGLTHYSISITQNSLLGFIIHHSKLIFLKQLKTQNYLFGS